MALIEFLNVYRLVISIFCPLLILSGGIHVAFSDGLFQENLPPATVGDRQASLFTKVNPPVLTADSHDKRFFELRLYDAKTGNNISNVNYFITVTKEGKLLMRDLFYSKVGPLRIQITPHQGTVTVYGSPEPFLGGWMSESGQIDVQGPVLLDGGLYHFEIEIFGIDRPNNIFKQDSAPRFDSYLSVGDIFRENLTHNNIVYNSTLISYYDKIHDFKFDPNKLQASWVMPFNWNLSRIKEVNIFVHEELKVPKSFAQFANVTSFDAKVNGQPVTGRSLAIDPFSSEKALIIHYLLTKNDIVKVANLSDISKSNNTMKFTLSPIKSIGKSSTDLITDTGGIHSSLLWSPNPPTPKSESKLTLKFNDALSDTSLNADVNYDLMILNSTDGRQIIKKVNLVAANGIDIQKLNFPEGGQYQIEIKVNSLKYSGQTSVDPARNGIARGFVILPR
jgi:hypothetical protein